MDKEETKLLVEELVGLSRVIAVLEESHRKLTDLLIQKGAPNVENPDCFDHRRN